MSETGWTSRTWLFPLILGVVVVGLVAIALTRGPTDLDPDSPEGTIQEYLTALDEQRYEDALAVLHPQWGDICDPDDIANMGPADFTARLGHVSTAGGFVEERFQDVGVGPGGALEELPSGTEFIDVTITRNEGGGFGSGWDEYVVFELVEEDGFYWIVGDPWPYFTWNCQGR